MAIKLQRKNQKYTVSECIRARCLSKRKEIWCLNIIQGIMIVISLEEKVNKIIDFFEKYNIYLSNELRFQIFDFLKRICSYEEEETKIFPHLILGHNIETEKFSKLFPVEIIHLVQESDDRLFFKRLKPLLPFCNNGWRVYIDVGENKVDFGIIRNFSGIEGLTVDEVLSNTNKDDLDIIRKEYNIGYFMIKPINANELDIIAMDGEKIRINFSLIQPSQNSSEKQKEMFIKDFLSQSSDEKLFRAIKKIVDLFSQKLHGTICLIVDEKCNLPNAQLADGIFLDKPIDLIGLAKKVLNRKLNHTPDYIISLNEKYYAISGLFLDMLNFDGITVIDTSGKIRAYNVFITPINGAQVTYGGARKRAAQALLDNKDSNYVGVYFQSQDGNYFYERV